MPGLLEPTGMGGGMKPLGPVAAGGSMQPLSPMATGQATPAPRVTTLRSWDLKQPEIDSGSYAYWAGRLGPHGAEQWKQNQLAPYKSQVASYLATELMEGRPQDKPISPHEVVSLLHEINPVLTQDKDFMGRVGLWMKTWNDEATALQKAQADKAANLYTSGKDQGAVYSPDQRQLMDRHGWLVRGQGAGLAASPGLLEPMEPPSSQRRDGAREMLFGGYYAAPGQREAEKTYATIPSEAAKTQATSRASQKEQTRGYQARRQVDQLHPAPSWMTATDPETGRQSKRWSGGAQEMDLGRQPDSAADLHAKVLAKYLYGGGQKALSAEEWEFLQSKMKQGDVLALLQGLLGARAGQAGPGNLPQAPAAAPAASQPAAQAPPQAPPQTTPSGPPAPGAVQGGDGRWYVQQGGRWFVVEQ